jgi:hypothetical protein
MKSDRAKINAVWISFPMRCHSIGCGMASPDAINNAIDYAKFRSRIHNAVIRVYDAAGNVIETHESVDPFGFRL